ncbi:shikimate dehydrogenase [Brevibacillus humidisoli]|uniref:shikimate dehydrogenase n=1 Tax=Brevibacillus humidisoli TaxID=2895522 RepID=UPI001E3CC1DF|nr:shikimate dehydrogenase [Brevibacillus humidisoli]UFJ38898.1 shikimate dehydrogenase [Brevibacillus humidisoli]
MITSKTTLVGLLGHPVHHSQSPLMHNTAFTSKNLDYAYAAFDVSPHDLPNAVKAIRALGLRGVNVTIPHKVAILPQLDEIDPLAKRIGAVNTVVNENGRLIGYNTDGLGYVRSLIEETNVDLAKQTVTLIGAGGAARAVACTLAESGVQEIRIINRSREKAEQLAGQLRLMTEARVVEQREYQQAVEGGSLLINTTSIGMYPHTDEMPIPAEWLHSGLIVSDLIYNPLQTQLLAEAERAGAKAHSGVGMFINQGALAFELWTGIEAPVDLMRQTVLHHLQQGGN